MVDVFNLLKELLRAEPELIAAFAMGLLVAVTFLSAFIYAAFNYWYGGKIAHVETDLRDAQKRADELKLKNDQAKRDVDDAKKKARERKNAVEAQTTEIAQLTDKLAAATQDCANQVREIAELKERNKMLLGKNQRLAKNAETKIKSWITQATSFKKQLHALNEDAKLIEKLQGQLWDMPIDPAKIPPFRPLRKKGAPIIAVTNLKGGVGKTTLTANIAATYCHQHDKRVLVIDLDFQASLTNLCLPADLVSDLSRGHGKFIDHVFKDAAENRVKQTFDNVAPTREPRLHLLAASENLANVEEQSKARWLMNRDKGDVRGILRSILHDPSFQESFDLILIDCPPRWTTASINAIACCDYVLVPTQLDRLSAEAVPRLLAWLRNLKSAVPGLYANFEILGVIGNLAFNRDKLIAQEQTIWEASPEKCAQAWIAPVYHFATIIKDKSEFRRAANNRAFAALMPPLQPTFLQLVEEIEARRSAYESR